MSSKIATTSNTTIFPQLPTDAVGKICSYLPTQDLVHVFQTCKGGNALQSTLEAWQGRVDMTLQSDCPYDVTGIQHQANLRLLAQMDKNEGTKKGDEVQAFLGTIYPQAAVEAVMEFIAEEPVNEGQVLLKHHKALEAEKLYKVFPKALIDALGGYEKYLALPELNLNGKKNRLGEPLNIFNIRPEHLVCAEGYRWPMMRGVTEGGDRFISLSVRTPYMPYVLTVFERSNAISESMKLGKYVDMPLQFGLGSNMVSQEDIQNICKIIGGTHENISMFMNG